MSIGLDDDVSVLPGVGPRLRSSLQQGLGIRTIRDLLAHYPRRYQDAGEVLDLSEVAEGEPATLLGEVTGWNTRRVPGKRPQRGGRPGRALDVATATVRQASGAVFTATFFNQAWRPRQLAPGTVAAFSGTVGRFRNALQLSTPDVQVLGRVSDGLDAADAAERLRHQRLLAVYPAVEAVPSFRLAELVETALDALPPTEDWVPADWLARRELIGLDEAVRGIHLPADHGARRAARRRLAFDELLCLQIGLQWRRARLEADTVGLDNAPTSDGLAARFVAALPFAPTGAQRHAMDEIAADLAGTRPMHRLLQGDVGSGKTLIAIWAMLCAVDRGRQAALMVPTEILAEQHHRTLQRLLAPLGVNVPGGLRVEVLTSSSPASRRRRVLAELLTGDVGVVVGTHALLEEGVRFADLGVVVIDEQHRFGVSQRVRLKEKAGAATKAGAAEKAGAAGKTGATEKVAADPLGAAQDTLPDVLVMTATPIPRSLALTVYGDLDVTVLDELPPGRTPVVTQLITPEQAQRRDALYAFVREQATAGGRCYVVCPFVEPSEAAAGTSAVEEHRRLSQEVFPDLRVDLVHGRMRPDDKEAAMARFTAGESQVLVATTVVEVGVDVPEATVMVVEDAERFGISQLHQLRGRVGRGADRSYCVLFAGWNAELGDEARARLEAVASTTDGFALAEVDLDLRGAGQLFGERQSGLPDLRLANLRQDLDLVGATRDLARALVADDPDLGASAHARLRDEVLRRYEGGLDAFAALETG